MRRRQQVYLHIGGMKTGTTFLQRVLEANPDPLAADRARFAGGQWRDQVRGVRDALGMAGPNSALRKTAGAWDQLVDDMRAADRRSIVSMEFLSFTRRPGAERVVNSLAPAEVHVVLSVRSAGRVLPAQWQEQVQNRSTISWQQWCEDVPVASEPASESRRAAQRAVGVTRMVRRVGTSGAGGALPRRDRATTGVEPFPALGAVRHGPRAERRELHGA
jgi:hypothetical protein